MSLPDFLMDRVRDYLITYTTYDVQELFRTKRDEELAAMKTRIEKAMATYPIEILEYLETHPLAPIRYTKDDLLHMTYNELAAIRKQFGIKSKRTKVKSVEPAREGLLFEAEQALKKQPLNETCQQLIMAGMEDYYDRESFLTEEEARMAYGEDYSDAELRKKGIIIDREPSMPDTRETSSVTKLQKKPNGKGLPKK